MAALYRDVKFQIKFTNGPSKVFGGDNQMAAGCSKDAHSSAFWLGLLGSLRRCYTECIHAELPTEVLPV